jgi:hypothetical protein
VELASRKFKTGRDFKLLQEWIKKIVASLVAPCTGMH